MTAPLLTEAQAAALFVCAAPQAVDGDTLRCRGVGLVRLEAIDAPDNAIEALRTRSALKGGGSE